MSGESGSVVFDCATNKVYGHVVGSGPQGHAYVTPLVHVLGQLSDLFGPSTVSCGLASPNGLRATSENEFTLNIAPDPFDDVIFGEEDAAESIWDSASPESSRYSGDIFDSPSPFTNESICSDNDPYASSLSTFRHRVKKRAAFTEEQRLRTACARKEGACSRCKSSKRQVRFPRLVRGNSWFDLAFSVTSPCNKVFTSAAVYVLTPRFTKIHPGFLVSGLP